MSDKGKYTVTIHVDELKSLGDVGHAFITLTYPDGSTESRGFYPGEGRRPIDRPEQELTSDPNIVGSLVDGGVVKDDSKTGRLDSDGNSTLHDSDYSPTYEVSEDQFNAMVDHVRSVENNSNDSYTVNAENCTKFVRDVLQVGEVDHPMGFGPNPNSLIPGWNRATELGLGSGSVQYEDGQWYRVHSSGITTTPLSESDQAFLDEYNRHRMENGLEVNEAWQDETISRGDSSVDNEGGGQGYGITAERPISEYHNDQTLRDFLNDPDYNQHLASNEGGGIAGDYEKYLQEQVADWDDDGDGRLSAEEREFRDDLNNFAKHNEQNAASQSDSDAAMHESERGEGEYDPDSIVGFVDGKPVTAAEAGLVSDPDAPINQLGSGPGGSAGINPTWGGNDLNNDGIVSDAELLNLQKSAIQSGLRGVNDLYNAIDGGDWLGVVDSGLDVSLAIDQYLDTKTDGLGGGSEGFISEDMENGLDAVNAGFGFYNALENGSTVSQISSGMIVLNKDMEQSLSLFISWNAPRNEPKKRTLSRRATRSLCFSAKTGAAELTRISLKQSSRLSVLSCDARRL